MPNRALALISKTAALSTTFILVFIASPAWAFAEPLQTLGATAFNVVIGVLLAAILGLIIALVVFKNKIKGKDAELLAFDGRIQHVQEQLDRFTTGILQLDADGNVIYANRMAAYYLTQKVDHMLTKALSSICPKDLKETVEQALQQTQETHIQCLLGSRDKLVRMRIAPQKKPIGDIVTLVAIEDIHSYQEQIDERQGINEHLLEARSQANIAAAELIFAEETIQLNEPTAKMLGVSEAESIGLSDFTRLLSDGNRPEWERAIKQLKDGYPAELEVELAVADKVFPASVHAQPYTPAGQDAPVSATLVLTSHAKLAKLKLESEHYQKQVKTLVSASPLPVYFINAKNQIVDCNRPFCAMFKVELNRLKGKHIDDVEFFSDEFKALHKSTDGLGAKRKSLSIEIADEQKAEVNLHLLSYKVDGAHAGMVALIEDLTPVKQLEQEAATQTKALQNFIEQSPLGIALFNDEDKITQVNPSLSNILNKSKEELESKTFYQLFKNPEHSGTAARFLHQKGAIENFFSELASGDDNALATRLDVSKLPGKETTYVCWISDSREQHFISKKLDRLITYSAMPIAVLGNDGFTQLNPAACAFFDVKNADELRGKSPASATLNTTEDKAAEMAQHLEQVTIENKVNSFSWVHEHNGVQLPCEVTLVPLFDQQQYVATLCLWVDLRAIEQANAARLEAVNLRAAAEREIAEKQQLLESSQDLLASRARSLEDTQQKLQAAETDLAAKLDTIQDLQQAHEDITGHLQSLQDDYARNRELLAQSQEANAELEAQLEESSDKVNRLQKQRNQIADALQYSEKKHKKAQEQLAISEQNSQRLKEEQAQQQASLEASLAQIESLKNSIDSKDKQLHDVGGQIHTLQSQLVSSSQASEKLREQLINQRKASELAEQKRRELELMCQAAQAELSNKSSYVEHLQHEMKMLEQMSQQQKGDMEKQTQQLEQELQAKQAQLDTTAQELAQARELSEKEKQQSAAREAELAQLHKEMEEVEKRSIEQQQKIAEADAKWQAQQAELQAELKAKQDELQRTTEQLSSTQQQTEEEKAQQAALLEKLKAELQDVEQRAAAQDEKIAQSDQQWQQKQQALAEELAAKKAQLNSTQAQLDEHQRQVDAEKLARKAQQDKLAQLKQEMADVESRATKQREMMAGNDEQWRQHHAEIEKQKQQLQQALEQAEAQNKEMQSTLASKLEALKSAESTVSKTQSDEQKLQQELNAAKEQADALQARLAQQEEQEKKLKQQVAEQQSSLQQREDNIQALQAEQKRLTEALRSVKEEYAQSKASLNDQNSSQQELNEQLKALEAELQDSKQQLSVKENALQDAQKQIASSADKLAAQEQALIDAQKEELKQVNEQQPAAEQRPVPEFAKLPMPAEPSVWFDLLPYLQHHQGVTSLANTLQDLMDNLEARVAELDNAVEENNLRDIQLSTRKLITLLESMHSAPLSDMANRLQMFCENRLIDNIAIFWPTAKQNIYSALRVIYSHLYAELN
ncbi:PAS domain-containing protein [Alteromonas flava]|uniref:PAS domain-containing protein n=1 Tax=Alteromonas flava TaxID=2048003 RepID=UPI000C282F22|nr:PAS domain-containing protein [Alteromonas flava]